MWIWEFLNPQLPDCPKRTVNKCQLGCQALFSRDGSDVTVSSADRTHFWPIQEPSSSSVGGGAPPPPLSQSRPEHSHSPESKSQCSSGQSQSVWSHMPPMPSQQWSPGVPPTKAAKKNYSRIFLSLYDFRKMVGFSDPFPPCFVYKICDLTVVKKYH